MQQKVQTMFSKQLSGFAQNIICHAQSLHFYSQRQGRKEVLETRLVAYLKCIRSLIDPKFARSRLRQVNCTELWRIVLVSGHWGCKRKMVGCRSLRIAQLTLGMQMILQNCYFLLLFYCLVQCRNIVDNCMDTVLHISVLGPSGMLCLISASEQHKHIINTSYYGFGNDFYS